MRLSDFDYELPTELIAQEPLAERDASRLLTLARASGVIGETGFSSLPELLQPGDLLVLNDTRVIPARLLGRKESGGRVEVFLVRRLAGAAEVWHCLVKASKSPRAGSRLLLDGGLTATCLAREEDGSWQLAFSPAADFLHRLEKVGAMPLPPYIRRSAAEVDRERYQTVFATAAGAVAAPTAGLHMTPQLLERLAARGVATACLTLHVGLGTFQPVRDEDLSRHRMHREAYTIPPETVAAIAACRERGGRVVALGTTVTRALEHAALIHGAVTAGDGEADLFILPGFRFRVVDALVTNFHLPKSTLLMLVAAFAGRERVLAAYAEAVRRRFRFFSYGDAMFIA